MNDRRTILVVDDEPDVVKSVQDLLRLEYRVLGATSAPQAMQVMEQEEVHVVMTDQRMPEMTGVEFLKGVRGEHPDAIRLLFTGYADIRAVIDAINQGNVYRYITKPWDPDELQSVIREAVERFNLLVERKRLLTMLQSQNKDLEKANVELVHANQLKYAFIQVASHELRTPLTILMGLTRLAQHTPNMSESLKNFLTRIDQAAKRLQHLVDQLISMLLAGQFERPLLRERTNLAELLTAAADDIRPFIELRNQQLKLDIPADLGWSDVDAAKIRDSINHLLLNAIKFTPDEGSISLGAERSADHITISVSDNGAGMDQATQQRLFEPFFTGLDVSHHSSGHFEHGRKGLGLGLSVVKAFVEMHGGTVEVQSDPGRGTRVTLQLPQSQPAAAEARSAASN